MVWENRTFDVENDFHGMYYLYGIIGLALFLLFLLYFAELIVRAPFAQFSTVHDAGGGSLWHFSVLAAPARVLYGGRSAQTQCVVLSFGCAGGHLLFDNHTEVPCAVENLTFAA